MDALLAQVQLHLELDRLRAQQEQRAIDAKLLDALLVHALTLPLPAAMPSSSPPFLAPVGPLPPLPPQPPRTIMDDIAPWLTTDGLLHPPPVVASHDTIAFDFDPSAIDLALTLDIDFDDWDVDSYLPPELNSPDIASAAGDNMSLNVEEAAALFPKWDDILAAAGIPPVDTNHMAPPSVNAPLRSQQPQPTAEATHLPSPLPSPLLDFATLDDERDDEAPLSPALTTTASTSRWEERNGRPLPRSRQRAECAHCGRWFSRRDAVRRHLKKAQCVGLREGARRPQGYQC